MKSLTVWSGWSRQLRLSKISQEASGSKKVVCKHGRCENDRLKNDHVWGQADRDSFALRWWSIMISSAGLTRGTGNGLTSRGNSPNWPGTSQQLLHIDHGLDRGSLQLILRHRKHGGAHEVCFCIRSNFVLRHRLIRGQRRRYWLYERI